MPVEGDLYVLSGGGDEDGSEMWVRPRPVCDVVADVVTEETDLSSEDLDDLDEYVDRGDLATHLDGEPAAEPLTFTVEGQEVVVQPDGTVNVEVA